MSQRKVDLLWAKSLLLGQRFLQKAKIFGMHKGAGRNGHEPKPGPSHPQMGSEDMVLSWWGWLVMESRRASRMMNSERKPDSLQHYAIALVVITPPIKMGLCFQILVPVGIHQICTTHFPKTNTHWGWLCWSWCSSSTSRQQFRAASAGVTGIWSIKMGSTFGLRSEKTWHQHENRVRVIDQFAQEVWVGPSVCLISSGFRSLQIILDNCPVHQLSCDIQWFCMWLQGLFNSLAKVCFLLVMGLFFVCLISVTLLGQTSCWVSVLRHACCWSHVLVCLWEPISPHYSAVGFWYFLTQCHFFVG